jgi:monothiol glutaredoxin
MEGPSMSNINEQLQSIVDNNDVVLFMKGVPDAPQCGFSNQAVQIFRYIDVNFKAVNCLETDELRQGIKSFSNWPTIPQIYLKGEFIGGADILREMFQNGDLFTALSEKGVAFKAPVAAQA